MLLLRSLLFYVGFWSATIIFGLISVVLAVFPRRLIQPMVLQWNRFVGFWLGFCCGIHYKIRGDYAIPRPSVIVSNHQSSWETFFLQNYFHPLSTVLKRELLRMPFFGWGLKLLEPIAIDRSNPLQALKQIKVQGKRRLEDGRSILIFPEGTRRPIDELGEYKRSAADIAQAANVAIVPIAHNAGKYWVNKKIIKYPGTIQVVIGDPIEIQGQSSKEVMQKIHDWTESKLTEMKRENLT